MTIFSDNPYDRRMERLMMTVPNFAPRGVGFRFAEAQIFITATATTPTEILTATMQQIRCPPFRKRFNEYIESEENPMTYINEKHRARFTLAAKNVHRENYALLSALYLLTADQRLWSCCKHHINNGCVFFENIKLNNCSERAYTLYCAAKDLTLGTKHITVSDLSDADLVPPIREQFGRHNADAEYRPASVITKMDTPELTRDMLVVDRDMEVDYDIGHQITCYLETWFDVDKKFGTDTAADDDKWLNLYAKYDPFADTLRLEFTVTTADSCEEGEYVPTDAESQLIKDMIAEKLREEYGQTPKEFCEDVGGIEIGGMTQ